MASLTGTKIKDTYDSLLKVSDNGGLGATAKQITDGLGTGSSIYLSTSGLGVGISPSTFALNISGSINIQDNDAIRSNGELIIRKNGNEFRLGSGVATEYMALYGGGQERMRIDSSGDVGIGGNSKLTAYSSTFRTLYIHTPAGDNASILELAGNRSAASGNQNAMIQFWNKTSTAAEVGRITSSQGSATNSGELQFATSSSGTLTERMRITSGGNVLINYPTSTASDTISIKGTIAGGGQYGGIIANNSSTYSARALRFFNLDNSNVVGEITMGNSSTSYNTSSDYRLKENVVPMTGALDRVALLKPSRFNFISDPEKTVDGFLAHEVQEVIPEAATGSKDAMRDEEYEVTPAVYETVEHPAQEAVYETIEHAAELDAEGNVIKEAYSEEVLVSEAKEAWTEQVLVSEAVMGTRSVPDYQGIDQSKIVPLLVGAIQELTARLEALETV